MCIKHSVKVLKVQCSRPTKMLHIPQMYLLYSSVVPSAICQRLADDLPSLPILRVLNVNFAVCALVLI